VDSTTCLGQAGQHAFHQTLTVRSVAQRRVSNREARASILRDGRFAASSG
jgi:hypothetical protein